MVERQGWCRARAGRGQSGAPVQAQRAAGLALLAHWRDRVADYRPCAASALVSPADRDAVGACRREAARLAIEKALATLPGKLDDKAQAQLVNQSIQNLGNA